jgi:hypothetical protein
MSLLQGTDVYRNLEKADRKSHGYGFILVLVCIALALVVAAAIFAPVPVGSAISGDTWFVGP